MAALSSWRSIAAESSEVASRGLSGVDAPGSLLEFYTRVQMRSVAAYVRPVAATPLAASISWAAMPTRPPALRTGPYASAKYLLPGSPAIGHLRVKNSVVCLEYGPAIDDRASHPALHRASVEGRILRFRTERVGGDPPSPIGIEKDEIGGSALRQSADRETQDLCRVEGQPSDEFEKAQMAIVVEFERQRQ